MQLTIKQWEKAVIGGAIVIDAREKIDSEHAIVPESLCIPYSTDFIKSLKILLTTDRKMILIAEKGKEELISNEILKAGFTNFTGCLKGGFKSWLSLGRDPDYIINISAEEFGLELKYSENIISVDVRPVAVQKKGMVVNALPLLLKNVYKYAADLESDKRYILYSAAGVESFIACSVLHSLNIKTATNVNAAFNEFASENIEIAVPA